MRSRLRLTKYFYINGKSEVGPLTLDEIKYGRNSSEIKADTLIRAEGDVDFISLKELENSHFENVIKTYPEKPVSESDIEPEIDDSDHLLPDISLINYTDQSPTYVSETATPPSTLKYLFAWFCLVTSVWILNSLKELFLDSISFDMDTLFLMNIVVIPALNTALSFGLIFMVYKIIFKNLLFSRVLPWFYIFGTFAVMLGIGKQAPLLAEISLELARLRSGVDLAMFIGLIFLIRKYVKEPKISKN